MNNHGRCSRQPKCLVREIGFENTPMCPMDVTRLKLSNMVKSKLVVCNQVAKRFDFVRLSAKERVGKAFLGYVDTACPA